MFPLEGLYSMKFCFFMQFSRDKSARGVRNLVIPNIRKQSLVLGKIPKGLQRGSVIPQPVCAAEAKLRKRTKMSEETRMRCQVLYAESSDNVASRDVSKCWNF